MRLSFGESKIKQITPALLLYISRVACSITDIISPLKTVWLVAAFSAPQELLQLVWIGQMDASLTRIWH